MATIVDIKEESQLFLMSKQYVWEFIVKRAKIEQNINVSVSLSASPIHKYYNIDDMFDIRTDIDIEKEDILYEPIPGEKPNKDPFGNW